MRRWLLAFALCLIVSAPAVAGAQELGQAEDESPPPQGQGATVKPPPCKGPKCKGGGATPLNTGGGVKTPAAVPTPVVVGCPFGTREPAETGKPDCLTGPEAIQLALKASKDDLRKEVEKEVETSYKWYWRGACAVILVISAILLYLMLRLRSQYSDVPPNVLKIFTRVVHIETEQGITPPAGTEM